MVGTCENRMWNGYIFTGIASLQYNRSWINFSWYLDIFGLWNQPAKCGKMNILHWETCLRFCDNGKYYQLGLHRSTGGAGWKLFVLFECLEFGFKSNWCWQRFDLFHSKVGKIHIVEVPLFLLNQTIIDLWSYMYPFSIEISPYQAIGHFGATIQDTPQAAKAEEEQKRGPCSWSCFSCGSEVGNVLFFRTVARACFSSRKSAKYGLTRYVTQWIGAVWMRVSYKYPQPLFGNQVFRGAMVPPWVRWRFCILRVLQGYDSYLGICAWNHHHWKNVLDEFRRVWKKFAPNLEEMVPNLRSICFTGGGEKKKKYIYIYIYIYIPYIYIYILKTYFWVLRWMSRV